MSDNVITSAMHRMGNWVRLAKLTVEAEFPEFELINSFCVLNADIDWRECGGQRPGVFLQHVRRLAHAFGVGACDLASNIADYLPLAVARRHTEGCDGTAAWRKTFQAAMRRTHASRLEHPIDALKPVLLGYVIWRFSSSGVERGFATCVCPHRRTMSEDNLNE